MTNPCPEAPDVPIRRLGKAWYRQVRGLHVIKVQGSPYEMGRQHGALLRDVVPRGPLPYYRTYVELMLRSMGLGPAGPLVAAAIERGVGRRVAGALPEEVRQSLRGLADGAGMDHARLLQGAVMPDSLMWLATALMVVKRVPGALEHRAALGLHTGPGCSSAVAWGPATVDGRLLHARNMDYHGVEAWPRAALVTFHQPDHGLRYVSVGAAGIPLGGFTAMNEAGLTLAVHQHMFSNQTTLGGTPVGVAGDRVMREASTLEQAEALLRQHRPIGCWTYLIADGPGQRLLCHEETARRRASIYPDPSAGRFAYSNIFLDPVLGASERDLYSSYWRNNMGRLLRVRQLLDQGGPLTPLGMAAIMADPGDDACRLRRAISMLLTVASVVFRPEDRALWVATGEVPVSENPFVPFSLASQDHAPALGTLKAGPAAHAPEALAFRAYRDAYLACFERDDLQESRRLMRQAAALQLRQPLYQLILGLLCLKDGSPSEAEGCFDAALALSHPDPQRLASFHLWRGRARDLLGRRAEAVEEYRAALAGPHDRGVGQAAGEGLGRPFSRRRARRVNIEFAYGDVMAP